MLRGALLGGLWRLLFALFALPVAAERQGPPPPPFEPVRIARGPHGTLLASDYVHRALVTLDPATGEALSRFGLPGRPLGLAAGEQEIYVGNETSAGVEVYHRAGRSQRLVFRRRLNVDDGGAMKEAVEGVGSHRT